MNHLKARLIEDPRYRQGLEHCLEKPHVLIALTNVCNLACSYCSTRSLRHSPRPMDFALAERLVDQTLANGWELTFGQTYEPFMHPRIADIAHRIFAKGRRFRSATNGLAIRPDTFDIPMDLLLSYSATEEDYAYRGAKLSFAAYQDKILRFLRHRLEKGVAGTISLQIADYGIFTNGLSYDKAISDPAGIYAKTAGLARLLDLPPSADPQDATNRIAARTPVVLCREGDMCLQVQPTKIMPNAYDAFVDLPEPEAPRGYCDSCFTTISIQADGSMAFCCCDPTAQAVAGRVTPQTDLKAFWLGKEMTAVRNAFRDFKPLHSFCTKCLTPVSEHIKPLLTVSDPGCVAAILRDQGVTSDLPWFTFPKS